MAEEAQQSVPTDGRSRGIVKWFDAVKGYGFINQEGDAEEKDIFVHQTVIKSDGFRVLNQGDLVEFTLISDQKGLHADNVCAPGGALLPAGQRPPPTVLKGSKTDGGIAPSGAALGLFPFQLPQALASVADPSMYGRVASMNAYPMPIILAGGQQPNIYLLPSGQAIQIAGPVSAGAPIATGVVQPQASFAVPLSYPYTAATASHAAAGGAAIQSVVPTLMSPVAVTASHALTNDQGTSSSQAVGVPSISTQHDRAPYSGNHPRRQSGVGGGYNKQPYTGMQGGSQQQQQHHHIHQQQGQQHGINQVYYSGANSQQYSSVMMPVSHSGQSAGNTNNSVYLVPSQNSIPHLHSMVGSPQASSSSSSTSPSTASNASVQDVTAMMSHLQMQPAGQGQQQQQQFRMMQ